MKAHRRHCERSEAIQSKNARLLDCFASLAMTERATNVFFLGHLSGRGDPKQAAET
jgi:hypothetical protein